MRAAAAVVLLSFAACKEKGPTPAELEAARKKVCAERGPRVRAKWEQAQAANRLATDVAHAKADAPATRAVKLRTLHPADADATADVSDPTRSALAACLEQLEACESDRIDEQLAACERIDTWVLVRVDLDEPPAVNEAMLNKYTTGHLTGDALAFSLPFDGGVPEQVGVAVFDTKLRGGVDVERDATTQERERALNDALRKQLLHEIEAKLRP